MLIHQLIYFLFIIPTILANTRRESESEVEESRHVDSRSKWNDEESFVSECIDDCFITKLAGRSLTLVKLRKLCKENCMKEGKVVFDNSRRSGRRTNPDDFHRSPESISSSNFNCELKCKANKSEVFRSMPAKKRNGLCKEMCKSF